MQILYADYPFAVRMYARTHVRRLPIPVNIVDGSVRPVGGRWVGGACCTSSESDICIPQGCSHLGISIVLHLFATWNCAKLQITYDMLW